MFHQTQPHLSVSDIVDDRKISIYSINSETKELLEKESSSPVVGEKTASDDNHEKDIKTASSPSTNNLDRSEPIKSNKFIGNRFAWAVRMISVFRNLRRRITLNRQRRATQQQRQQVISDTPDGHIGQGRFYNTVCNVMAASTSGSCPSLQIPESDLSVRRSSQPSNMKNSVVKKMQMENDQKGGRKVSSRNPVVKISTTEPELIITTPTRTDDQDILTEYVINVKTSDRFGAGTDANVFIQLYGKQTISEAYALTHSNNVNKFERNQLDTFVLGNVPSVGHVKSIKIWHDNKGVGAAWHLAYVEVSDTTLGLLFRFPCHGWLADNETARGVVRQLRCFEVLEGPKKAKQEALGVAKQHPDTRPVTPILRKSSRQPPVIEPLIIQTKPLIVYITDDDQEPNKNALDESVFTPIFTRPPPTIRFPLADEDGDHRKIKKLTVIKNVDNDDRNTRQLHTNYSSHFRHSNTEPHFSMDSLSLATAKTRADKKPRHSNDTRVNSKNRKESVYNNRIAKNSNSSSQIDSLLSPINVEKKVIGSNAYQHQTLTPTSSISSSASVTSFSPIERTRVGTFSDYTPPLHVE